MKFGILDVEFTMVDTPRIDYSNGDCTERTMLPEYNKYQKYFSPLLIPEVEGGKKSNLCWLIGVFFSIIVINKVDLLIYKLSSVFMFGAMIFYFVNSSVQNDLINSSKFNELSFFRNSKAYFYINRFFFIFSIPLCCVMSVVFFIMDIYNEEIIVKITNLFGLDDFDLIYDNNTAFSFLELFLFFISLNFIICLPSFIFYLRSLNFIIQKRIYANKFEVLQSKRMMVEYGFAFFILLGFCVNLIQENYEYSGVIISMPYSKFDTGLGMQNTIAGLTVLSFYLFFTQTCLLICMVWKNSSGGQNAQ